MKNNILQFGLLRARLFQEPDNHSVYSQLMLFSEIQGEYHACRALFEELLDAQPYAHLAWYHLGLCMQNQGETTTALEAFEFSYCAHPQFKEGYFAFAVLALQMGEARQAIQCLQDLIQRENKPCERCWLHLAECYLHLQQHGEAVDCLRKCLKIRPDYAEAQYLMGVCFAASQHYQMAVRFLRQAIRVENRREDFHQALAEVYSRMGKNKLARQHYWSAIDLSPDEPFAWIKLATFLLQQGHPEEALDVLAEAAGHTIGSQLDYCCAACLFLLGKRSEALARLRDALAADRSCLDDFFIWAPTLSGDPEVQRTIAEGA